ncbi:pirin family protein [Aliikangiella sp. G2MR2-5]|uniref:pirin family protein n=1 Tax=Aliikangiella sp. G2MR2-5 TaxID=2788943 RepID=UPI0018AB8AA2|nr:pirin family protein [Aliikangiella sp. G2MR2-5]
MQQTQQAPKARELQQKIKGIPAADGDGVQLTRIIGSPYLNMLDPFLLLDAFGSDKPQDYIGGFPPHPHRGFETVTYMLAGKMRHQDSVGNSGVIETGGVQWMTAGKGIIHSEMPEQTNGLLAGFQLWVNLPARQKMTAPQYQEKSADEIPVEQRENGIEIKVIAGKTSSGTKGIIDNPYITPTYWDVKQPAGTKLIETIERGQNAFVYPFEGEIIVGDSNQSVQKGELAVFEDGDIVSIETSKDARYLLVAGKPLNEPVARGGPFVMNTREEVQQAFNDYQTGNFI